MKTIGHHTCLPDGGDSFILSNAPFKSLKSPDGNFPFLGEGYYYWDNNIELAHHWGETHYKKNYKILQSDLHLVEEHFLDLVGNRSHMMLFAELHEKFSVKYNKGKKWPIGKFIEVLKDLNKRGYKGIFPWKVSRAIDLSRSNYLKHYQFFFVYKKDNYTNLSPRLVICIYELKDVVLQSEILTAQN